MASKLATTSMAAAAAVQERSQVWRDRAQEVGGDLSVRAKEAYAAAKRSEFVERGTAYLSGGGGAGGPAVAPAGSSGALAKK
ncbi:hypothetical protein HK405_003554, partial [Cladochytrium tenue]